jgi:carboxylesterase
MREIVARVEEWRREEVREGVPLRDLSFLRPASGTARALLLHGAGGGPSDFHGLAADLAADGIAALCPLLPGHGLGSVGHEAIRFDALLARALEAFDLLGRSESTPAVIGQSVGAVLGIRVALERPVGRLIALAPALRPRVGRRAMQVLGLALLRPQRAWARLRWQRDVQRGIRATAERLPDLRCPLLILHSTDDPSVSFRGAEELATRAGSPSVRLLRLAGQGHVLSLAPDRARIAAELAGFVVGTTGEDRSGSPGPRT